MVQSELPFLKLICVQQNLCLYTTENVGVMSTGMVQIESGAEDHLQMAVALAGPVTVSIDSRHSAFQVRESSIRLSVILCVQEYRIVGKLWRSANLVKISNY